MSPGNQALIIEQRQQMNILLKGEKANAWNKKSQVEYLQRLSFLAFSG